MKRALTLAIIIITLLSLASLLAAGQGRAILRPGGVPRGTVSRGWVNRGVPIYRYGYPTNPYYYYPNGYYYQPFYPPAVVISPYGPSYYLPRVVEVTAPYFCVLHNAGFVTRAGMLDHLAGTHKFPLESAVYFCPDGTESCIYPVQ